MRLLKATTAKNKKVIVNIANVSYFEENINNTLISFIDSEEYVIVKNTIDEIDKILSDYEGNGLCGCWKNY
jgi:hypothetical protein